MPSVCHGETVYLYLTNDLFALAIRISFSVHLIFRFRFACRVRFGNKPAKFRHGAPGPSDGGMLRLLGCDHHAACSELTIDR